MLQALLNKVVGGFREQIDIEVAGFLALILAAYICGHFNQPLLLVLALLVAGAFGYANSKGKP